MFPAEEGKEDRHKALSLQIFPIRLSKFIRLTRLSIDHTADIQSKLSQSEAVKRGVGSFEGYPLAATYVQRNCHTPARADLKDVPSAIPALSPLRRNGGGFVRLWTYSPEKTLLRHSTALTTAEEWVQMRQVASDMALPNHSPALTMTEEWR